MKKINGKMISYFRKDGRISLTALSRKTGLPVSTIHERLKRMVASKVVRPSLLLNFSSFGFNAKAFLLISVPHAEKEPLLKHLSNSYHVNSLFRINNGWTALCECIFREMVELENFVEQLERKFSVSKKEVFYVLNELSRENFLCEPGLAESLLNH